ncbi:hypothetical protein EVAR_66834_1 [Eumeta japonica]|uniref:Uncharacterized protein n=1 Tax=Eumeta variegata TaxID=151549 RepID=A0A4C2AHG7_EUMVA|nr:hypothetical protein EVAR_66834_1 [Eumeta japonica]
MLERRIKAVGRNPQWRGWADRTLVKGCFYDHQTIARDAAPPPPLHVDSCSEISFVRAQGGALMKSPRRSGRRGGRSERPTT